MTTTIRGTVPARFISLHDHGPSQLLRFEGVVDREELRLSIPPADLAALAVAAAPRKAAAGAGRPVCPRCGVQMVRAHVEMEGFWLACWVCDCKSEYGR